MTRQLRHLVVLTALAITGAPQAWTQSQGKSLATETLVYEARSVLKRAVADKVTEKRLEQIVLTLASRPETPAARKLIEDLSMREPKILVPHEEGGAMIPFVDVGAAARFGLRNWTRHAARQEALRATRTGDPGFLQNYFAANRTQQAGMLDAIHNTNAPDLLLYRDELMSRVGEAGGDRLAALLAESLADKALFERVIVEGSAAIALDAIRTLKASIGADAALQLMRLAIRRPDIASATMYEVGSLTATLPAAGLLLWESLADPELGGSAAAVLARHADGATVDRLIGLLLDSDQVLVQKRALLALRLSGDSRATRFADQWQLRQPGADR